MVPNGNTKSANFMMLAKEKLIAASKAGSFLSIHQLLTNIDYCRDYPLRCLMINHCLRQNSNRQSDPKSYSSTQLGLLNSVRAGAHDDNEGEEGKGMSANHSHKRLKFPMVVMLLS